MSKNGKKCKFKDIKTLSKSLSKKTNQEWEGNTFIPRFQKLAKK
jgi:hypothetical protein